METLHPDQMSFVLPKHMRDNNRYILKAISKINQKKQRLPMIFLNFFFWKKKSHLEWSFLFAILTKLQR